MENTIRIQGWNENVKLKIDLTTLPVETQKAINDSILQVLLSHCDKHGKHVHCDRMGLYNATLYTLTLESNTSEVK